MSRIDEQVEKNEGEPHRKSDSCQAQPDLISDIVVFECRCQAGAARNGSEVWKGGDPAIRTGKQVGHWEVNSTNL